MRPPTTQRWTPALAALAVVVVAALAADSSLRAAHSRHDRRVARQAAAAAGGVAAEAQGALTDVVELAQGVVAAGHPGRLPSLTGQIVDSALGEVRWVDAPSPDGTGPALAAALDVARDRGLPLLSGPVDGGGPSAVAPVYRLAAGGLTLTPGPATGGARRQQIAGWVIGELDAEEVLARARPAGSAVTLVDGDAVLAGVGTGTGEPVVVRLEVGGRSWELVARAGSSAGADLRTAAVAVVGMALAVLVYVATRRLLLRLGRESLRRAELEAQVDLHERVAPMVQHSLDLGEVLPAVAVQLVDHFGLAGLVTLADDLSGTPVKVFGIGVEPDPAAQAAPTGAVPAGASFAVPLERAGRAIGTLRVKAGRHLSQTEVASLAVVSQALTAAILNARLYEQQQRAVSELERIDGLKTVFLGTASHELRTPVTAISGFARLLSTDWETMAEEQRQLFVDRIRANAASLDSLVQDLLDFSRLERGEVRVALDELDLGEVVGGVLGRLQPVVADHHLTSDLETGILARGDPSGVERVVTNLLSNAVKFSPAGSTIRVAVERHRAGGGCLLVDDAGPGVPEDQRDLIFSRFYRGSDSAVVRTRGVGIGLSVVREFVDQMGATVDVGESPLGGARFMVSFPPPGGAHGQVEGREQSGARH